MLCPSMEYASTVWDPVSQKHIQLLEQVQRHYWPFQGSTSFVDLLRFFCLVFAIMLCLCARLFICALWSPARKGLTSWLSFVVSNCEFVTFPLVSWVRYGTWLYRFLIFVPLLTSTTTLTAHQLPWWWRTSTGKPYKIEDALTGYACYTG